MSELDLVRLWSKAWNRIIFAQLAPTGLLITTVALLQFGLGSAPMPVRAAAVLILLASGILGALAEFTAADEASAVAASMSQQHPESALTKRLVFSAKFLPVVKYLTPAIFVVIFLALLVALLGL